ncbi:hypothetical protein B296_00002311, partial [Ensete ventricosum]
ALSSNLEAIRRRYFFDCPLLVASMSSIYSAFLNGTSVFYTMLFSACGLYSNKLVEGNNLMLLDSTI